MYKYTMERSVRGSCHCGLVKFEVTANIDHVRVCDCSICLKRGALIHRVPESSLILHTPLEKMTPYRWGRMSGVDYFCPVCGILPFRRPSQPTESERQQGVEPFDGWAINARCLEDIDLNGIPKNQIYGSRIKI